MHICSVVSNSLQPHGLQLARHLYPWDFPSKNTRMDCHFLLQGVFPTQRLNLPSLVYTHTHTHTQSVIKETKLSQCCNSHYHLQNENDSWCKGNNDQSQLPKVHQENPVKTESSERFCPRCMCMCSVHTTESMVISL